MHADSRPGTAETPQPHEPDPHAQAAASALPTLYGILRHYDRRLYISPPESVSSGTWVGPSSFLGIRDEAAEWRPTHTLTDDPQPPPTRAAAIVADLARANAWVALCFTSRNAVDARIRYLRQMEELTTAPGVSAGELEAIQRGLLDLAEGCGPKSTAAPQSDAGPFTHTFTFSPRKSGKSEALRKARAEHAATCGAPRSDPTQVPFVMLFPDDAGRAEGPGREFKLRDLFGDEELKSLPYSSGTVVCAPSSVYAVLFEQLPEKERREFAKTAISLASLGGDELSIAEIIGNLLVVARGYGARGKP